MENQFFRTIPIMEGVTAIGGLGGELAYLVEGADRALLIDGLTGVGSLKAFVRELTDLPVTIALTHGHGDHNGAAYEYGECYIHPLDVPMLYPQGDSSVAFHNVPQAKYESIVNGRVLKGDPHGIRLEDVVVPVPMRTYPIFEGDVIDLGGGVQLEVAEIPGHTVGSVVFIDHSRRIAIFGDACNKNTLLGATTVEEYKEALELFCQRHTGTFDAIYCGHSTEPMPPVMLEEAIVLCQMVLDGKDDRVPAKHRHRVGVLALRRGPDFNPENGFHCNFMYPEDKVHGRSPKRVIRP